jgi:hypothetical protein
MAEALRQHSLFMSLLSSSDVQNSLRDARWTANGMVHLSGPLAKDLMLQDGRVAYFVLGDGTFFFDTPHAPAWALPVVLLCPVLGFLIPWGTMRALAWRRRTRPRNV